MTRLDRYVLVQIGALSLLALGAISFLAMANEIRERVEEMPIELVTLTDLMLLGFYFLPSLVVYIIPITYLVGILMIFGRLAQNGEIIAMKAAGIPLKRLIAPVIALGALLSLLTFAIQDRAQPWAMNQAFKLVYNELPRRVTLDRLQPGVMHDYEGWHVYFGARDQETSTLYDIDLVRPAPDGGVSVLHAESAQFFDRDGTYELVLKNGHLITPGNIRVTNELQRLTVPAPSEAKIRGARNSLSLTGLIARAREVEAEYRATHSQAAKQSLKKARREIGERVSLPFACLAVAFLGAPLGVRAKRSGRSYTFAAGFSIALVYYVLKIVMEPNSLHSQADIIVRAWVPNIVLLLSGIVLVWKVDRV